MRELGGSERTCGASEGERTGVFGAVKPTAAGPRANFRVVARIIILILFAEGAARAENFPPYYLGRLFGRTSFFLARRTVWLKLRRRETRSASPREENSGSDPPFEKFRVLYTVILVYPVNRGRRGEGRTRKLVVRASENCNFYSFVAS